MDNHINGLRTDGDIMKEIGRELIQNEIMTPNGINVEVKNGKVVLDGEVGNNDVSHGMEEALENISGVIMVVNNLKVARL